MVSEDLISRIEKAFEGSVYPGDHAIVGELRGDISREEAFAALRGYSWRDLADVMKVIDHKGMCKYRSALFYLTPQALAYYLPAYMISTVVDELDTLETQDTLLFIFSGYSDSLLEQMQAVGTLLSDAQRQIVLEVIFTLYRNNELEDPSDELVTFWATRLSRTE